MMLGKTRTDSGPSQVFLTWEGKRSDGSGSWTDGAVEGFDSVADAGSPEEEVGEGIVMVARGEVGEGTVMVGVVAAPAAVAAGGVGPAADDAGFIDLDRAAMAAGLEYPVFAT